MGTDETFLVGMTHIFFSRCYSFSIGFLSQMILLAGNTMEMTIAVFAWWFWFLCMLEKFVVATVELKAGMTSGSTA